MAKYDPKSPILCDSIGPGEEVKDAGDMKPLVQKKVNQGKQLYLFDAYDE